MGSWRIFLMLLIFASAAPGSTANDHGSTRQSKWYEVRPRFPRNALDSSLQEAPSMPRRLFWIGGMSDDSKSWRCKDKTRQRRGAGQLVHPLRTNLFQLNVRWTSSLERRQKNVFTSKLELEFDAETGYCLAKSLPSKDVLGLGTWQVFPWGIQCTMQDVGGTYEYSLTAGLHLNSFGKHPKLVHGSILRTLVKKKRKNDNWDEDQDLLFVKKNRRWFRPVVGRFSGVGIGQDMADFSYHGRGVGLSE